MKMYENSEEKLFQGAFYAHFLSEIIIIEEFDVIYGI